MSSVDPTSAISGVLAQMRTLAHEASSGVIGAQGAALVPNTGAAVAGRSFADELSRTLNSVAAMQNQSSAQARAYQAGVPGVSLNDVIVDMQKSSIAFQATVQVRNRLVSAYQEIASMPV